MANRKRIDIRIDIPTCSPGLDDGSGSLEESLWLGHVLARQGVKLFAATPHFYATQESPQDFLRRRERAEQQLFLHWPQEFPPFLMGAEVRFFDGMSRTQELPLLVLEGTNLLLLEMPFSPWSSRMVEEVLEIQERQGLQVLWPTWSGTCPTRSPRCGRDSARGRFGCSATPAFSSTGGRNPRRCGCFGKEKSTCLVPIATIRPQGRPVWARRQK